MTGRGWVAICMLASALACALSLGGVLYAYCSLLLCLLWLYSIISCLWVRASVRLDAKVSEDTLFRGGEATLTFTLRHACPLPVSALDGSCSWADKALPCSFHPRAFVPHKAVLRLPGRHVGYFEAALSSLVIGDLFGLLRLRLHPANAKCGIAVLPRPFDIDKPSMVIGDEGRAALARTQEDYNAPEDTRAYLPGDAMKRIHWKLSSRRRELVVRRFETPAPPDTLILLDCSVPLCPFTIPEGKEALRDALCETAVAVALLQMQDASPVRLPIYSSFSTEFSSDREESLPLLQETLAMQPFDRVEDFASILNLELRRMRRTGAVIIITTQLTAPIVEAVRHIRRMGPSCRMYLCTHTPDSPAYQPLIARLQHHLVEVCYVTPRS